MSTGSLANLPPEPPDSPPDQSDPRQNLYTDREEGSYDAGASPEAHRDDAEPDSDDGRPDYADVRHVTFELNPAMRKAVDDANNSELLEKHIAVLDIYLQAVNEGRIILNERDRLFLKNIYASFIRERNSRADEVESPEAHEAADITNRLLKYPAFSFLCIDGRVNLTLEFGIAGKAKGGSIELPAGDPIEFAQSKGAELVLDPSSNAAKKIDQALENNDTIFQILDSHLACAAREASEGSMGNSVADHGLRADVVRKLGIAKAMEAYVSQKHPGKKVIPMQFSFDPHNGYGYVGLEKEQALKASEKEGYTSKVLDQLATEGTVFSAERFAHDPVVEAIFNTRVSTFQTKHDWKNNYKNTALQFWQAIEGMRSDVFPILIEQLTREGAPYEHLKGTDQLKPQATLLLANAFNAYCNNKDGHYSYGEHEETTVAIQERAFGPFNMMDFGIYGPDVANLASSTVFASTIVRGVRKKGKDPEHRQFYESQQQFEGAPVPIVVTEVVRDKITEREWENLRKIDWTFLQGVNWKTLDDSQFLMELNRNNPEIVISARVGIALNGLRQKMSSLYSRKGQSAELLMNGKLFALPTIVDSSRKTQGVVPFFMKGFEF